MLAGGREREIFIQKPFSRGKVLKLDILLIHSGCITSSTAQVPLGEFHLYVQGKQMINFFNLSELILEEMRHIISRKVINLS